MDGSKLRAVGGKVVDVICLLRIEGLKGNYRLEVVSSQLCCLIRTDLVLNDDGSGDDESIQTRLP